MYVIVEQDHYRNRLIKRILGPYLTWEEANQGFGKLEEQDARHQNFYFIIELEKLT